VGRLNYSLQDRKLVDTVVGFEYDSCCWIGRVVLERLQSSTITPTQRICSSSNLWVSACACSPARSPVPAARAQTQADFIVAVVNSEPVTNNEVRREQFAYDAADGRSRARPA
jgi:hypothetical protein